MTWLKILAPLENNFYRIKSQLTYSKPHAINKNFFFRQQVPVRCKFQKSLLKLLWIVKKSKKKFSSRSLSLLIKSHHEIRYSISSYDHIFLVTKQQPRERARKQHKKKKRARASRRTFLWWGLGSYVSICICRGWTLKFEIYKFFKIKFLVL